MKRLIIPLITIFLWFAGPACAKPGDAENGERIYAQRCVWCHGEEGDGEGAAAERLNPPPRDFTAAQYKIKTTAFDDDFANDDNMFRMIRDGMPGTAMPGWSDVLSEQEMWDLVWYIKTLAGLEEEPLGADMDYGTRIESSPESIARGKELFLEDDRCVECHGKEGKGDAAKGLKDDSGFRTWPRNLTKPWTFRASNDPKDIFARISTGIPSTQMPAFGDPASDKVLSVEDRWHVANYVNSLAKTDKVVAPENTVVKAEKFEGPLPGSPDDPQWEQTTPTTFFLVPQIVGKERFFTPSNDTVTARAAFNEGTIAILLEWDDRTRSIPGDETAGEISDPELAQDSIAIQLPVVIPEGSEKPYFGMGDVSHPVNMWQWKSGTTETPESVKLYNAMGFTEIEIRDAAASGIEARGIYENGTWKVLMTRPRKPADSEKDIEFSDGEFIPIAFAAWDGSNSEQGSRHTMTTWYWLLLKPDTGTGPAIAAVIVVLLLLAIQFWWVRSATPAQTTADRREQA
ncbi:MAG: c-type cytochrome [bacterium]|nr:c-type cytochrome [bacterium]